MGNHIINRIKYDKMSIGFSGTKRLSIGLYFETMIGVIIQDNHE